MIRVMSLSVRATGSCICSLNKISLCIKIFLGGDQLIFADIDAQGHGDHENQIFFLSLLTKVSGKRHLQLGVVPGIYI